MNKVFYLVVSLLLIPNIINAQHFIKGSISIIVNGEKEKMPGASIYYSKGGKHVVSDDNGNFSIAHESGKNKYLVASFMGFKSDSVLVTKHSHEINFELVEDDNMLEAAYVIGAQKGTAFSKITALKTEVISKAGLQKLACCNLSESFENSATVTVGFADAVSGAKQVQMLGLSGIYSQMLAENIPTMRGLASTYGWNYTPGPWLQSIQVSKGASSVTSGYESLSGQINLDFKQPKTSELLDLNLFADHAGRYEANASSAIKVSDKLWTGLLLHGSIENKEHDGNDDSFLDMPKTKLFNAYNRWYYENAEKGIESRTGIKFLYEEREGGQVKSIADRYKTTIDNKNINVYNKTGIRFGKEGQSIGLMNSFTYHNQESVLGKKEYAGDQYSYYTNLLFTTFINNTNHFITTGASLTYDKYNTHFIDALNSTPRTNLNREEIIPGAFAQYTYTHGDKFTFILGLRGDYNSEYGALFTPRTNIKYNITDDIIFRASAGKGYRSPNVVSDNIGLMASSRNFNLESINDLDIEEGWNYGANISFDIPIWDARKMTLSLDYFRTDFKNQAVIDIERNKNQVYFYNLKGNSFANAFQVDLSLTPFTGFDIYTAFRYNKTKITLSEGGVEYMVDKPLTSKYRGLINLSYATKFQKWKFDATAQLNGPSRLPSMTGYSKTVEESPSYPIYFAQVTKNSKRFDVYLGVENIFDYKQSDPIIDSHNPFGPNFDSSIIWGPLMGRKIYAGIRLRLGALN